uniref:Uncharacterized protein n=1 Tax=Photinus pyralis TaxID=7054 RepID=A0A1Y1KE17_PHOPY
MLCSTLSFISDLIAYAAMAADTSSTKSIDKRTANILTKNVLSLIAPIHPKRETKKIIIPITTINWAGLKWCDSINSSKSVYIDEIVVPIEISRNPTITNIKFDTKSIYLMHFIPMSISRTILIVANYLQLHEI